MTLPRMNRMLLPAVLLGMQACWLYAWTALVEAYAIGSYTLAAAIVLFMPVGAIVYSFLRMLPVRTIVHTICYWAIWIILTAITGKLLLFTSIPWMQPEWVYALPRALGQLLFETRPAELLLLLGSACAWHLGNRPVRKAIDHSTVLGDFQFGLMLLIGALLAAQGLDAPAEHHVLLALAFFALSLTGIAITRSRQDDSGASLLTRRHFASSLAGLLLTVSLLGLLASVAVTPALLNAIVDGVRHIGHLIGAVFAFFASLLPGSEFAPIEEPPPPSGDDSELREFYRGIPWPPMLRRIMFILWLIIVAGMVLFALWRICSQILDWFKRRSDTRGIEMESLDSGLLADILAFLLWVRDGVSRMAHRAMQLITRTMPHQGEQTWSEVYASFVRWSGRRIRARRISESVHEYQRALSQLHPDASPELILVTDIYARARYGGHVPDTVTVREMAQAALRIRRTRRRQTSETDLSTERE